MKKLLFIFLLFPLVSFAQETIIVAWSFDDSTHIADTYIPANEGAAIVRDQVDPDVLVSCVKGGVGEFYLRSNRFHKTGEGEIQYWKTQISTVSYIDINISSRQGGNAGTSAPRDFKLQYSLDDTVWEDIPGGTVFLEGDWVGGYIDNLSLPEACNDREVLYIRWLRTSGIGINGNNIAWNSLSFLDDVQIKGVQFNPNDADSHLSAGTATVPANISSEENVPDGLMVFDVQFTDAGSGDGLPTIINHLQFTQGIENTIINWQHAIAGAKLIGPDFPAGIEGLIGSDNISFEQTNLISIADGGTETYELYIWLKTDLSGLSEGDMFDFRLSYEDVLCDVSGSYFSAGEVESGGIAIDIVASQLRFTQTPQIVVQNSVFSISVQATDANGNFSSGSEVQVTLSRASGSGNLSSDTGLSQNLQNGVYTWTDLRYSELGTFSISAEADGLTSATSNDIESSEFAHHLADDFEDGVLTGWQQSDDTRWAASDNNPINGNYSLRQVFNNSVADIDVIAHPMIGVDMSSETKVWRFQLRYENSAPSSNNHWAIYLMADADQAAMKTREAINGYVLGVNFTGTDDFVKLWAVTDGAVSEVIATDYNWEAEGFDASVAKGFEVARTPQGEWEIKIADSGGFESLLPYGNATHTEHTQADYFGVYYKYSSTMHRLLTVDDVYFGPVIQDTVPPAVNSVIAFTPNRLLVTFNELLDVATAEEPNNYFVDNGVGIPASVSLQTNERAVVLNFTNEFESGFEHTLTVDGVEDLSGNATENLQTTFTWKTMQVEELTVMSANELLIQFSKIPTEETATELSNYTVKNEIGNPLTASFMETDSSSIYLVFENDFVMELQYHLNIKNIEDTYGNIMPEDNISFIYYKAQPYDVVINEIMCDINPLPEALPAAKYIELYNRSAYDIELTDWTMQIEGNSARTFPAVTIEAGEYVIICSTAAEPEFEMYGKTIPILSETQLTIGGKPIYIRDKEGALIETVNYSSGWYDDPEKEDGGWALERIDYDNFCGENANWTASLNFSGGTPGQINSVYAENPDNTSPEIESIQVASSKELKITFSEKPDYQSALNLDNYLLNNTVKPSEAYMSETIIQMVHLKFEENFPEGQNTLRTANVNDPCENVMEEHYGTFTYELIYPKYAQAVSSAQLKVIFSEKPNVASAQNTDNYMVNNDIGKPVLAQVSNSDSRIVYLQFSDNFEETLSYQLSIELVEDINNNSIRPAELSFAYYIPKPFDVVFTEVMSDINPAPQGLPAVRYTELFNTSDFSIDLTDWVFQAEGQTQRKFPSIVLESGEYLVVATTNADFGDVLVTDIMGTSDMTISGRTMYLYDASGNLIHELPYSNEWFGDSDKIEGGWSLEIIDPYNFCSGADNWLPTTDPSGGTPGRQNSVNAPNPDVEKPVWESLQIVSSNTLDLFFTKDLNAESIADLTNYNLTDLGQPEQAFLLEKKSTVRIQFADEFSDKQSYQLTTTNIADNCENQSEEASKDFTYHRINIENLWVEHADHILIKYSEVPKYETAVNVENYEIDADTGNPFYAYSEAQDSSVVHLLFDEDLPKDTDLKLTISNIFDRNQNPMPTYDTTFIYRETGAMQLVINEVLFNPYTGGEEFVELYNRANHPINLKHLKLARRSSDGGIEQIAPLSNEHFYMQPGEYLAFTSDKEAVLRDYYSGNEAAIIELSSFPNYTNTSSTVLLIGLNDTIIDEFQYHENMHFPLLTNKKGVSLERISFDALTQDESNWHSAAESVGFATPGYKNSQAGREFDAADQQVWLEPKIFSPDHDGIDDYLMINYKFDEGGYTATVMVYNSKGRQMRILENNTLLAAEGSIKWDGLYENGSRMRPGIYLIHFKAFTAKGEIKEFKKVVTLAVKY